MYTQRGISIICMYINQFGEFLICLSPWKPHMPYAWMRKNKGHHGLSEVWNCHSSVALCAITFGLGFATEFGLGDHFVQSRGIKSGIHHPAYYGDPGTLQFLFHFLTYILKLLALSEVLLLLWIVYLVMSRETVVLRQGSADWPNRTWQWLSGFHWQQWSFASPERCQLAWTH